MANAAGESAVDSAAEWIDIAWIENGAAQCLRCSGAAAGNFIDQPYRAVLESDLVRELLTRLDWPEYRWSVYGRRRDALELVLAGDRIELCPPLQVDPKTARNRRVAHRRREATRSKWLPDRRNIVPESE